MAAISYRGWNQIVHKDSETQGTGNYKIKIKIISLLKFWHIHKIIEISESSDNIAELCDVKQHKQEAEQLLNKLQQRRK